MFGLFHVTYRLPFYAGSPLCLTLFLRVANFSPSALGRYYTGDISWVPLKSATYWMIEMDSVTMNGQDITSSDQRSAIVDSGTSLLIGPVDSVAAITANCSTCYENFAGTVFTHVYVCVYACVSRRDSE